MSVRFYTAEVPGPNLLARTRARSADHQARLWRASGGDGFCPPGTSGVTCKVYGVMHRLGLFANPDYGALLLARPGEKPDHVSSVFPGFFRFPFMGADDLQIGATSTVAEARGQGLATRAILEAMEMLARPGRRFWYLTEADNTASCRVVENAGFTLAGEGRKHPRLGLRPLGYYAMSPADDDSG